MDSFSAHTSPLSLATLPRPVKLPLPLIDPAFALTASAALSTRPLSAPISNFDSRPSPPSLLDDPVVIDRTALLAYIAQMAKYEQDIIRLHNEKLLWLHERDILMKQVAQMEVPGSTTTAPVKPTLVSAHDDWVSNVLRSLSSAQVPTPSSSSSSPSLATSSSMPSLATSPSMPSLASPALGELDATPPRLLSLKRKRRTASEDDDSSTVNDADYDESFSDDLSEEEFASPAKRAKNGPNAIPSFVSHAAGPTASLGSVHVSQFASYSHSTPMAVKAESDDLSADSSHLAQETCSNTAEHGASSPISSSSTSSGSHIPYTSATSRRGHLPERAIRYLKLWFFSHKSHPYPTEDEKNTMMDYTGLSRGQINNWFTNARRRLLPRHDH